MRFVAALACAFLIQVSPAAAQDAAGRDPQLAPMDAHYARLAQAYAEEDAGMVLAYRTPDFYVDAPGGMRFDYQQTMQMLIDMFGESQDVEAHTDVMCAAMVNETDAQFVVTQHLTRSIDVDGQTQRLQTATTQTETWRLTPEGWRLAAISNILGSLLWVDGTAVEPFTLASSPTCPTAAVGASAATP